MTINAQVRYDEAPVRLELMSKGKWQGRRNGLIREAKKRPPICLEGFCSVILMVCGFCDHYWEGR